MPAPALPQPWHLPGTVGYRREYRDPLGRPMSGSVTITNATRIEAGGVVIPARSSSRVDLSAGVLDVQLYPNTYQFVAELRTEAGDEATDRHQATVTAE